MQNINDIIFTLPEEKNKIVLNIIKISGFNLRKFIKPIIKKDLIHKKVLYTSLFINKEIIFDDVIALFFESPNSLTGQDILELHLYNNKILLNKISEKLIELGARYSKPGEFLERRYLNGKISLIECELINNKIRLNNNYIFSINSFNQKKIFLSILKNLKFRINLLIITTEIGYLTNKNQEYKDYIFIKKILKKYLKLFNVILNKINKFPINFSKFKIMILGNRNVGKSTFYNKICNNYESIVTSIPGTTKNLINKKIKILLKNFEINDTAGLKFLSKDLIEKIGIIKCINNVYNNDLIFYMVDNFNIKEIFFNIPIFIIQKIFLNKLIILINKTDKYFINERIFLIKNIKIIFLSLKYGYYIKNIKCYINKINNENKYLNKLFISNVKIIRKNFSFLYKKYNCNSDLFLYDLINFQKKFLKIIGNYTNTETINSFFRNFCLGK